MAYGRDNVVQNIRTWKNYLKDVENIPLNPYHNYKDHGDIYERLHAFMKLWLEDVYGCYTNAAGELEKLPEDLQSPDSKDWIKGIGGKMTPLAADWFQVALKGAKKDSNPLPHITEPKSDETKSDYNDVRYEVDNALFPAYRALRDSYEKRSIFQWIFNHRQYVAERDALKVMTNLITSMTGYSQRELDVQYKSNCTSIKPAEVEDIAPVNAPEQHQERVLEAEPNKQVEREKDKEVQVNEQAAQVGNENPHPAPAEPEKPIQTRPEETAMERFERLNTEEKINDMRGLFVGVIEQNAELNELALFKSMEDHVYKHLHKEARAYSWTYDEINKMMANNPQERQAKIQEETKKAAKAMFEAAFKGLSATVGKEITKIVDGEEVTTTVATNVFGINSLKDRIIAAQAIADLMMKRRTPVAFKKENLGDFAKGHHILENVEQVREFVKANSNGQYSEKEINKAVNGARNEFGVKYRNEARDMSHVYELDYRPNPKFYAEEAKALIKIQKVIKLENGPIEDKGINYVLNYNIHKFKAFKKVVGMATGISSATEAAWAENEKKLQETYKNYDPDAARARVTQELENLANRPEPISVDMTDKKLEKSSNRVNDKKPQQNPPQPQADK
ncbi:MAG: hypothetical protein J6S04_07625 [Clostridia bacterium]|nr:hypothetical protein [Clostridia bacterium]